MRVAIDRAGRLVVPKTIRDALGFAPGTELELSVVDGHLEVAVPAVEWRIEEGPHGPVIATDADVPELTDELIRRTLDAVRERR